MFAGKATASAGRKIRHRKSGEKWRVEVSDTASSHIGPNHDVALLSVDCVRNKAYRKRAARGRRLCAPQPDGCGHKKSGHSPLPLVSETSARRRYIHGRRTVNRFKYDHRLRKPHPVSRGISPPAAIDAGYVVGWCVHIKAAPRQAAARPLISTENRPADAPDQLPDGPR